LHEKRLINCYILETNFDSLKALQYCNNAACELYTKVGSGNICTMSRLNRQVYCNKCKNCWVLTKDTFFYDLRTDSKLIIRVLLDLSEGQSQRGVQRNTGVTIATQKRWLLRAAEHVDVLSTYLEQEMRLERVQIDEFWSFVLKKRELDSFRAHK
jgi:hypothetical protein